MAIPKKISKRNKRGLIVLILLLVIVIMLPRAYGWMRGSEKINVSVVELDQGVEQLKSQKQAKKCSKALFFNSWLTGKQLR